jgi:hypothetical protein
MVKNINITLPVNSDGLVLEYCVCVDLLGSKMLDFLFHKLCSSCNAKFQNVLRQVGGFSPGTSISSDIKTDSHDITEILLKVALNTITPSKGCH